MNLLAVDTSGKITGIALFKSGECIGEISLVLGKGRDARLSSLVKFLLSECGMDFRQLDAAAFSAGPGSFTGLRVGAAYTKGVCFKLGIPLTAVNSLETAAYSAGFSEKLIVPLTIMKGGEVYFAAFKWEAGSLVRKMQDDYCKVQNIKDIIREPVLITGEGALKHADTLRNCIPAEYLSLPEILNPQVKAVGVLAARQLKEGRLQEIRGLEPNYLQPFPRNV
ncbi:tRNA (adenosine(37)-N6)-threonylcarbamoyltransferase complex dimerization subunit type 1 TsaB [bacterium]|nr:tRNA (adenosine(37)-N6)-threonylcarbamoyltransferase complex dimerization subunit type 1 TsaB [FCB group bacterium]MBL7192322.1 tRNA (adenosine(37)-N6)-threonylcarbamoyltransferase complex dimerization subunit type 1 TsaB [bacterium]